MGCRGQDQIRSEVYLFWVEAVITLAQKGDLDVAGRGLLDKHPPNPGKLYIFPECLLLEVLLGDVPQREVAGLLLQLDDVHLSSHHLYLLLELLILLKHLASPLLVILHLVLQVEDLCVDILGPDQVGIPLDEVLRFLLDLLDFGVRDLDDLLLMDGHPGFEELVEVVYVPAQGFEVVKDGLVQLYLR